MDTKHDHKDDHKPLADDVKPTWIEPRLQALVKHQKITVTVTGAKRKPRNSVGKRYTVYGVHVNCGDLDWDMERTYKEFTHLRKKIIEQEKVKLLKLPARRWIMFDNNQQLKQRLKALQDFFHALTEQLSFEVPEDHLFVLSFLGFCGDRHFNEHYGKRFSITSFAAELMHSGDRSTTASDQTLNLSHGLDEEYRPRVSSWSYALKAMLPSYAKNFSVGLLYIKVISAKNLPKVDQFGGCDPYVVLALGTQGDVKAKTTVVPSNRNPYWGEKFLFEVVNSTSCLYVDVYDKDTLGKDDKIGVAEIPLSSLGEAAVVRTFTLNPPVEKFSGETKGASAKDKEEKEKKHSFFMNLKKNYEEQSPQLTMQLQYRSSREGNLASNWNPEPLPEEPPQEYSINTLYANAMILLENIWPVVAFFQGISSVIYWEDPIWSGWVLLCFIACCYRPSLIAVLAQSWLLYYMTTKYAQHVAKRSRLPKDLKIEDCMVVRAKTEEEKAPEVKYDLGWRTEPVVNAVTKLGNLDASLYYYQVQLVFANETLSSIYALFDWSTPMSGKIFMGVCASTLYCLLFPVHYLSLIIGCYVLLMKTTPFIFAFWFIRGMLLYATSDFVCAYLGISSPFSGAKKAVDKPQEVKVKEKMSSDEASEATSETHEAAPLLGETMKNSLSKEERDLSSIRESKTTGGALGDISNAKVRNSVSTQITTESKASAIQGLQSAAKANGVTDTIAGKAGDAVEIHGLTKEKVAHLNGQRAIISAGLNEDGYYRVKIDGRSLDVRPRHLKLIDPTA